MKKFNAIVSCLAAALLLAAVEAGARDIYVSTSGADTNPGDSPQRALRTIAAASNKALAGDTVRILPGRYHEPIKPVRSGQAGKPITYRNHTSTKPILTHSNVLGLDTAILINNVSHIVVDGIEVDGVARRPNARVRHFARILGGSHVVIRNGTFKYAHGWAGVLVEAGASYVTIENNYIDWVGAYDNGNSTNNDAGDAIQVGKPGAASRVLIRGNRVRHAGHNLLALYGSNCVVEGNDFDNSWRDVYGGDAGGRIGEIVGSYNIFQLNRATGAGRSSDSATNTVVKVEGANNIARYNVLTRGNGEGVSSSARNDQPKATKLRIYANTIYKIGGPAWRLEAFNTGLTIGDNVFVNNLVVDPRQNPQAPGSGNSDLLFKVALSNSGPTANSKVVGNLISSSLAPKTMLMGFDGLIDLQAAQTRYPQFFVQNNVAKALFVKADPVEYADFALNASSPAIDKGQFLTTTVNSGRSKQLKVADSRFFTNGYGIIPGDTIQLQGSTQRVKVVANDHSTNTLTLDKEIDIVQGRGVALAYAGSAPDVGAREYGLAAKLAPPTQVTAN